MTVLANIGVPMIFGQVILMALALVPIVVVETFLIAKDLKLPFKAAIKNVLAANIWTTFVGVPLAWAVVLVLEMLTQSVSDLTNPSPMEMLHAITLGSAWLVPYQSHLYWMIPAAASFLLFPSFIASVFIETRVLRGKWNTFDPGQIKRAVLRANVWSYLGLFILGILETLRQISGH